MGYLHTHSSLHQFTKITRMKPRSVCSCKYNPKIPKTSGGKWNFFFVLPKTTTNTSTQEMFRQRGTPEMLNWKDIRVTNRA